MTIKSPQELIAVKLQQIQDAETEASRVLNEIKSQARNPEFKACIDRRLEESKMVLDGVRQALPKLGGAQGAAPVQNKAARGIIEEARTFLKAVEQPDLKEAVAIGGLQSLEHYCIATWGTVKALAKEIGANDIAKTMERALDSGKRLDSELTRIAESRVNPAATQQGDRA